ncbi:DUF2911 domain-containing protein [Hymenobacter sp. NST-14]|uniref:DUF2911 domain-containing protein n=1 Tax=Hymenobacter piscis TaxID=2839984 RepID=UPI001C0249DC|nr:DUF2911 domain-containing protein [Hymenobacter piscis]MBT9392325.1 DUF2911 domain-containing protein [Hymenobacter piscis]
MPISRLLAFRFGFLLALTAGSLSAQAQQTDASAPLPPPTTGVPTGIELLLPQASPHAVVQQTVGLTDVTVDYHSPSVRSRSVWGGLVPYDEVWRAGANENTLIRFSTPILLRGQTVPAGQYSLFVVPHQDRDWEVVLNRVTTHWGSEGYDQRNDVIRVPVVTETAQFQESLLYWFSSVRPNGAHLNLTWERRTVVLPFEVEVHKQVLASVEKALQQQPNDWQLLAQAAEYLVQNNLQPERALNWINESIRLQDAPTNNWIKARLLAQQQDYGTAIVYARKAIKLGDKDDAAFKSQLPNMRLSLTEWQARAY